MFEATFDIHKRTPVDVSFNTQQRTPVETEFIVAGKISRHNQLTGREEPDCHPESAITGLTDDLNNLEGEITAEETARQLADENLQEQITAVSVLANGYIHEQGIASSVWEIQHNLNKYPSVSVVDSAENEIVVEVEYIDKNNVRITMKGASKGRAYLN